MNAIVSLFAVLVLAASALVGVQVAGFQWLFGVALPYAGFTLFVVGLVCRVVDWARSPVPFRIPTTCGQQKSHRWIKSSRLDNPHDLLSGVLTHNQYTSILTFALGLAMMLVLRKLHPSAGPCDAQRAAASEDSKSTVRSSRRTKR